MKSVTKEYGVADSRYQKALLRKPSRMCGQKMDFTVQFSQYQQIHCKDSVRKLFCASLKHFLAPVAVEATLTRVSTTTELDLDIDLHPTKPLPLSLSHWLWHSFTLAHRSATDRPARHPQSSPCICLSRSHTDTHTHSDTHTLLIVN